MTQLPGVTRILRHHGAYRQYEQFSSNVHLRRGTRVDCACNFILAGAAPDSAHQGAHYYAAERDQGWDHEAQALEKAQEFAFNPRYLDHGWVERHAQCECWGYLNAYQLFLSQHRVSLINCQFSVTNETERYQGRPDQHVFLDDKETLLSLKSGSLPRWWRLQEAAYTLAMGRPELSRAVLQLRNDGKYHLELAEDPDDIASFVLLARSYHLAQEYFDERKEEATADIAKRSPADGHAETAGSEGPVSVQAGGEPHPGALR